MRNFRHFVSESKFLKAHDLDGRRVAVTIDKVDVEPVGQQKEMKLVATLRELPKPLVLNLINSESIAAIANTEDVDRWTGVRFELFTTKVSDPSGKLVDGIRIAPLPPPTARRGKAAPVAADQSPDDDVPF